MQENVRVEGNRFKGTLKYVTGYTQFSGDETEQSGNYLVVKVTDDNASTVQISLDGTNYKTLDSDGIVIARITDKDTQNFYVKSTTSSGQIINYVYSLADLVCNAG